MPLTCTEAKRKLDIIKKEAESFKILLEDYAQHGTAETLDDLTEHRHRLESLSQELRKDLEERLGYYRLRVDRGPLPSFAELATEFGKGNVSDLFDGRLWAKSQERLESDVTSEEVVILAKDFAKEIESGEIPVHGEDANRYIFSDDIVNWGLKHGYTPCDEKEAYAFAHDPQTRDLQREHWHVALGSSTLADGEWYVAVLNGLDRGRIFNGHGYDGSWDASYRFLFARKS